jgi:hypothetical protein
VTKLVDELVKSGKTLDKLTSAGGELRHLTKRLALRAQFWAMERNAALGHGV